VPKGAGFAGGWGGVSLRMIERKRRFDFVAPEYCTAELVGFVGQRLGVLARWS